MDTINDLNQDEGLGEENQANDVVSAWDALLLSRRDRGWVDIDYMQQVCGASENEILSDLRGAVYRDPASDGFLTADEYLSGDVGHKLEVAKEEESRHRGRYTDNVAALMECRPEPVTRGEIYVQLGSHWLPETIVMEFLDYITGVLCSCNVVHDPHTGSWSLRENRRRGAKGSVNSKFIWGAGGFSAVDLVEKSLNNKTVRVYDEVEDPLVAGKFHRVFNQEETLAVLEKQSLINREFQKWVWRDDHRAQALEDAYNATCVRYVAPSFNGDYLSFPGMNPQISLFSHQKDAVARPLSSAGSATLIGHEVGSGKTYTMVAAAMEMRRLGISSKNLFVVPNNVLQQWAQAFTDLYPTANVLVVTPASFEKSKRQKVLGQIRNGDYDAVVMAHSSFDLVPVSKRSLLAQMKDEGERLALAAKDPLRCTDDVKRRQKTLQRKIGDLDKAVKNLAEGEAEDEGICLDELGVTAFFLDEAHTYKNLDIDTDNMNILGVGGAPSKKCDHMLSFVRSVQRSGGRVCFATATPISNSVGDLFGMMYYLIPDVLERAGLGSFQAWAGTFASLKTSFEIDIDTGGFRLATRFGGFHNLPELAALVGMFADFHKMDQADGLPRFDGYEDVVVSRSEELGEYFKGISARADRVRAYEVDPSEDNLLKICGDARMASLDLRLVDSDGPSPKVAVCAQKVYELWSETKDRRATQLVMCDIGTPKPDAFDVYHEMKSLLVQMGIPEAEIAFVHDATTEGRRAELFERVRSGRVRVLMGSTPKLGVGVNVQDRCIAVHHLDATWRASDMVQREGRALRRGNTNEIVHIFRYVTEDTFDAFNYQLLQTKAAFTDALLSGSCVARNMDGDVSKEALTYAQVKALAIGEPLLRERIDLQNQVNACMIYLRAHSRRSREMIEERDRLQRQLAGLKLAAKKTAADCLRVQQSPFAGDAQEIEKFVLKLVGAVKKGADPSRKRKKEKVLMFYRGFRIVLPDDMDPKNPFVWLEGTGQYKVSLGDLNENGVIIRLNNAIDGLKATFKSQADEAQRLKADIEALSNFAARGNKEQRDLIRRATERIAQIDQELEERAAQARQGGIDGAI